MADGTSSTSTPETPVTAAPAASAPVVSSAPAPASPSMPVAEVAAPVAVSTASPATEPAPVAETPKPDGAAPVVEGAPPETPKPEGSEAPKPEGEAAPAEPPKSPYADLKVPEGITIPPETMSAYNNILTKGNIAPELAQELLEFAGTHMKTQQAELERNQWDVFNKTVETWTKTAQKEFGNRFDTVIADANWAIKKFGGTKAQVSDLLGAYKASGISNHPAEIRAWANVAKQFKERAAPADALPSNNRNSQRPEDRRYANRKTS